MNEEAARRQMAALYANEPAARSAAMPEHKTFLPTDLALDDAGTLVARFAQLKVIDHDGDVTMPGAFPTKAVPMSAYGHGSWDGALPVGRGSIAEEGDWAVFKGRFFLSTSHGRDAYETVKGLGDLAEYSYGYHVLDGGPGTFEGKAVRELRKLDVFEVSPVLIGAGIGTGTLAIKSGAPGPEMPYAEHVVWVQTAVSALMDRTVDRAEWRAKEGRVLSAANRAALAAILEALDTFGGTAAQLRAFLDETDPQKAERQQRRLVEVLLAQAPALGVPV